MFAFVFLFLCCVSAITSQHDPHFVDNRSVFVHLFEWKFEDIANECERFLAPNGYAGVQVSPINEYVMVQKRPWWERYQPISYQVVSRSGNEVQFREMVRRCNKVGVRIYVDAVFNHMSGDHPQMIGTGGSTADVPNRNYPAVPYYKHNFHKSCPIQNYNNATQVRDCELVGLPDLDQSQPEVQQRILEFLNFVVDTGVAGFRIDAAKHMWPRDLKAIYDRVSNLSVAAGFPPGKRPFIYQEVIDVGGEAVKKTEYNSMGVVTEFRVSSEVGKIFRGGNQMKWLLTWGPEWGFLPSRDALIFVDNHDNQRGHGAGGGDILTYKDARAYKMATAFLLAHPYGIPRVISSFDFSSTDQGPPADKNGYIISPTFNADGACTNGWVCEHRWREISNMVKFKAVVKGTQLANWWDNGNNQIAFSRGNKGFIVLNNDAADMSISLSTGLPAGTYCDIISGAKSGNTCTGTQIVIANDGKALVNLSKAQGVLALHVEAKL